MHMQAFNNKFLKKNISGLLVMICCSARFCL